MDPGALSSDQMQDQRYRRAQGRKEESNVEEGQIHGVTRCGNLLYRFTVRLLR